MPIPHDKCILSVAEIAFPLLLMQYRFFWNPNAASQLAFFQTQTLLHLITRSCPHRDWKSSSVASLSPSPSKDLRQYCRSEYYRRAGPFCCWMSSDALVLDVEDTFIGLKKLLKKQKKSYNAFSDIRLQLESVFLLLSLFKKLFLRHGKKKRELNCITSCKRLSKCAKLCCSYQAETQQSRTPNCSNSSLFQGVFSSLEKPRGSLLVFYPP